MTHGPTTPFPPSQLSLQSEEIKRLVESSSFETSLSIIHIIYIVEKNIELHYGQHCQNDLIDDLNHWSHLYS